MVKERHSALCDNSNENPRQNPRIDGTEIDSVCSIEFECKGSFTGSPVCVVASTHSYRLPKLKFIHVLFMLVAAELLESPAQF